MGNWEENFMDKIAIQIAGKKYHFPMPNLDVTERHRRRLAQRNERTIYNDKCDLTGKAIISLYSPESPYKVYSQEAWWSDGWDAKDYGRDYDFSRPFFEQFAELRLAVPRLSLMNANAENSDYCNVTTDNKNCYLVFGGDFNEDAIYSIFCFHSRDVSDLYWVNESELTYDCMDCIALYNVKYSANSNSCRDSSFLCECRNCANCFGCVGLRNKEYYIFNKKYSKEEYELKMKEFRLDTWSGVLKMKEEFAAFKLKYPVRDNHILNSENVTGDRIRDARNMTNCFDVNGPAEDVKDVFLAGWNIKDAYSSSQVGHNLELVYETLGSIRGYSYAFSLFAWDSHYIYYSDITFSCENCFACTNLQGAKYCILNKQYTKEEYEEILPRIIEHMKSTGEWGQYFPVEDSTFAYNESVAQDFMPMTKEDALADGLKWHDEERAEPGSGPSLPDSISDVEDDIMKETLVCEKTGRAYKIIPKELTLYRRLGIPLPRHAPATRNEIRIAARNPFRSWERKCAKCDTDILTSFSPEKPEIVHCSECYLAEIY